MKQPVIVAAIAAAAVLVSGATVYAKAADVKKAQDLGFKEIKSCAACHASPKGGKELNARGQFLVNKKAENKASAIDLNWLKDYKEKAE